MLPTQVSASDDIFLIFAELEKVEPKIFCRFPDCKSSSFTEKGTRGTHERNQHPRKVFPCRNCDFFAENLANIEKHNFRYHHAAKENISERYRLSYNSLFMLNNKLCLFFRVTEEQLLQTCARPEVYFDVAIVEPFQHEVDKVLVTENVTTVESVFQQPQSYYLNVICYYFKIYKYFPNSSCFDDDDWEPVYIDESPCQQESINGSPGQS